MGGANITDTTADIERTVNTLATYFNNHFQFYGRKLNIEFFNGQGSITNELLGSGQQQADADAVTAAQSDHAFAELNGVSEPYDVALAAQHVISFGAPYLSASFMGQYTPYMWSLDTESNDVVQATSELYLKSLAGGNATYAGGSLQGKPRKVAIIAPSDPWYQSAATSAVQAAAAAGHPISDNIQYQLNLSTLSSQASNVISQLQNDGITTVVCGCDPVFPVYLTSRAAEQGYTPEWVVAGVALTDQDIVGQLFAPIRVVARIRRDLQRAHRAEAEHVRLLGLQAGQPEHRPANAVTSSTPSCTRWRSGFEMAGPSLTPATFQNGMRAYPGARPARPTRSTAPGRSRRATTPRRRTGPSSTGTPTRRRPTTTSQAPTWRRPPGRRSAPTRAAPFRCLQFPDRAVGRGLARREPRRPPRRRAWAATPARLRGVVLTLAAAFVLLFVVPALWPHSAPRGQILNGAEFGAVNGLLALGLVLTYRASRVINFSYGAMGARRPPSPWS